MKTPSTSESPGFVPGIPFAFSFCVVGVLLAMFGLAAPARLSQTTGSAQTTFQKIFNGGGEDSSFSLLKDADSNLVALGTTSSFGAGSGDMYLQKTDSQGRLIWAKSYGGASLEEGFHVASTSDGGYVWREEVIRLAPGTRTPLSLRSIGMATCSGRKFTAPRK